MARATESHPLRKRWRAAAVVVAAVMPAIALSQPSMAATTDGGGMAGAQRLAAGLAAWQAGDAAVATGELSRALLLLDPTGEADAVVDAYFYLGLAHLDLAQLDEAAAALDRAAELSAGRARSLAELHRWQALVARLAGDVTGAAELRASALDLDAPAAASSPMAADAPRAAAEVPTPAAAEVAGSVAPPSVAASASASASAPVAVDPGGAVPGAAAETDDPPASRPASETPAFDHFFRRRPTAPAPPAPPPADPP